MLIYINTKVLLLLLLFKSESQTTHPFLIISFFIYFQVLLKSFLPIPSSIKGKGSIIKGFMTNFITLFYITH